MAVTKNVLEVKFDCTLRDGIANCGPSKSWWPRLSQGHGCLEERPLNFWFMYNRVITVVLFDLLLEQPEISLQFTVCWEDFEWNWKNFQWELIRVTAKRAFTRMYNLGFQTRYILNPLCMFSHPSNVLFKVFSISFKD